MFNPVRARMVGQAGDWPWSSYRAMMGVTAPPTWLETDWVFGQFATDRADAQTGFAGFVAAGVGQPGPWTELRHQIFLGSDVLVEQAARDARPSSGELREVPRVQRRTVARPLEWFERDFPNRREAMARTFETGAYTMHEIAGYFHVHYATVSRAVRWLDS